MAVLGVSLLGSTLYGINDVNTGLGGILMKDATDPLYLNRMEQDWLRVTRVASDQPFSLVKEPGLQFISVLYSAPPADPVIITRTTTTHALTMIREDGDA